MDIHGKELEMYCERYDIYRGAHPCYVLRHRSPVVRQDTSCDMRAEK